MARSVIVEVRKAVVEGLKDAITDRKVQISYGWKGSDETRQREQIYTNRPRATHEVAALAAGRTRRNEVMDFDIVVIVSDHKSLPEEVDERALDLGQVVEEFIADNKDGGKLGIPGLNWIVVVGLEIDNRIAPTGAMTLAQYTVRYDARLT